MMYKVNYSSSGKGTDAVQQETDCSLWKRFVKVFHTTLCETIGSTDSRNAYHGYFITYNFNILDRLYRNI